MRVETTFDLTSYNFVTAELLLRKKIYDENGRYKETLALSTIVPEFRGEQFQDGMQFRVTIEQVEHDG